MKKQLKLIKKIMKNKRFRTLFFFVLLFLISLIFNVAFAGYSTEISREMTNIKVKGMTYSISIDGVPNKMITAPANKTITSNIIITSLNEVDSKYELTYKICATSACNSYIDKPGNLTVEYSSKTIDTISGAIVGQALKQIKIAIINNSATTYYIELDINAGYIHNTLALKNLITNEYNEEDLTIISRINGEVSPTFLENDICEPVSVSCKTNKGPSNTTGIAEWNGTKWIVNISNVDKGQTVCTVDFVVSLRAKILAQDGGATVIQAKGNPDFTKMAVSQEYYDTLPETGGFLNPWKGVATVENGIYATEDEYGISYYYRGTKQMLNNNLIFGGYQWKIVRINGDGSIRLLYNGTEYYFNLMGEMTDGTIMTYLNESTYVWNTTNQNDAKYVGYMYGGANGSSSTVRNGTTSNAATYNETSSNVKNIIDTWYQRYILGKPFENKIVDNLFCNDRRLQNEVGGPATGAGYGNLATDTYYSAYYRLQVQNNPTLKCAQKNDRFTVNDEIGNKALIYPVGLITSDEVVFGGMINIGTNQYGANNIYSYLNNIGSYWTMTPNVKDKSGLTKVQLVSIFGDILSNEVIKDNGIRPVINILPTVTVTGEGTLTNPYKVIN